MAATKIKYRRTSGAKQLSIRGLADTVALVEKTTMRSDFPEFKAGDTIKVHVRIREGEKERVQIFEGVVIARDNGQANRSFVVRKIYHGVGVERIFMETSPKIAKIEMAQVGRVRRAKLYYLRELEGKAARVAKNVETLASTAASASTKNAKSSV